MRDLCLTIAVATISLLGTAQAGAQSLSVAYQSALDRDPDWQGAREDAAASGEGDAQARALFRPKVGVTADAGYGGTSANVTLPPPVADIDRIRLSGGSLVGAVEVQQPLLNGEASSQSLQLRAGARAGEAQLEGARQQLMLRVADAYFAVLSARAEVAALEAQQTLARREQRGAQDRFDAGWAKITDVREAQARGDGVAAQQIAAEARRDVAIARFTELTGLGGDAVVPLRPDIVPAAPEKALSEWQQLGESTAPSVLARLHAADAATARVDQYRFRSQLKVEAYGRYGEARFPGGNDGPASVDRIGGYSVGVRLQMPLYTGGARESQKRQAEAKARGALSAVESARRTVRLDVQQAWSSQSSSVAAIAALRTALDSARLQEKAAITGRNVGVRTQSDVLAAQAQVTDIQRQLDDALITYERSRLLLSAAAGTITEGDLALVDGDLAGPGHAN